VRDSASTRFPAIRALSPDQFRQQLDWLQRTRTVIDLEQFHAAIDGARTLPEDAALLTFDDGFADHYEAVFPELTARGLSGVFFLAGDAMAPSPRVLGVHKTHFLLALLGPDALGRAVLEEWGRSETAATAGAGVFGADHWEHADERALKNLLNYEMPLADASRVLDALFARHVGDEETFARELYLGRRQVAEMARAGMAFGYHTQAHRMLSRLPVSEQRHELLAGVDTVRALTGQTAVSFCYPWGGLGTYTADTLRILEEAGYSLAFNTVRRRVALGVDGRYELPRLDTRDLPPYTAGEPQTAARPGARA
jgi:peptidoglycan/xylan/chitin deacetylase (PgdA/CDA1 family)